MKLIGTVGIALVSFSTLIFLLAGCENSSMFSEERDDSLSTDNQPIEPDLYSYAGGCFALRDQEGRWLAMNANGTGFSFVEGDLTDATSFLMKAADLATYLLYDPQGGYVVGESGKLVRLTSLHSELIDVDDQEFSPAEWMLEPVGEPTDKLYHLRHNQTGDFLSTSGVNPDIASAVVVSFAETTSCAEFPELSLDAEGTVQPRTFELSIDAQGPVTGVTFDDGSVWGIAEAHTHMMSNFGFGGGGVFHGATFHRLGVEHALGDCSGTHGKGGANDLFGNVFENKISPAYVFQEMLPDILTGNIKGAFHETKGYPDFTDWPSAPFSSTHQTQYYKWLERAWMGGLRLIVQHAVSNSVICELAQGLHLQTPLQSCNDMIDVDRQIDQTYAMEKYIDAQAGGPGKGFFRIVTSPAQAKEVIKQGKLAVVLGIETSNLFNCFSVPKPGMPVCDEAYVVKTLDQYHNLGIRSIFPVHKLDNAFTAGDGDRGFIEVGNFLNSGHLSNFVTEGCPNTPSPFDQGDVQFGGINQPRDNFMSAPPYDMTNLAKHTALTLLPHVTRLLKGGLSGKYCQKTGLTPLGEFMLKEMMKRGMIIEVDHFSQRSYQRAFEILKTFDYPPAATHGSKGVNNQVYALGGISTAGVSGCRDMNHKGTMLSTLRSNIANKIKAGAYPGEAWSWDLNGFASYRKPRFGAKSECKNQGDPKINGITYPFKSMDGNITFTQPRIGNRELNFNTEGLVHVGLMPEFIQDLRRDAESDEDLEPLFRSAAAYLHMWEKAEKRGKVIDFFNGDACPFDANKVEPGQCGCQVSDNDLDQDGIADCLDKCPADPDKTKLGICGCGIADTDTDLDGVPDCNDLCPDNPDKLDTGVCGCAAAEADDDGDGFQNCIDECPLDPNKTTSGQCGCGVSDNDGDNDGTADCNDNCASDANKAGPGICGCGTADTDSDADGTPDCHDQCPSDPSKQQPQSCGCGVEEGKCGLWGTYFNTKDLVDVAFTRLDPEVNFNWGRGRPASGMNDHHFSARWTGTVTAPSTEIYTFYTVSDDGVRLWVDGKLLINSWNNHSAREDSGIVYLKAGQTYSIKLEYYEDHVDAVCKLLWSSGAVPKQIISRRHLLPVMWM